MSLRERMKSDAEEMAAIIAADLGIGKRKPSLRVVRDMCKAHSANVRFVDMDGEEAGLFICTASKHVIFVSRRLPCLEKAGVLLHELVHLLCLHWERYEEYNCYFQGCNYDNEQFNELIARAVERIWVRAGGSTFHQGRLDD